MQILTIRLQNFGSFKGEHELRLSGRGLTLILGDNQDQPLMTSNGAGKSTVFKALDWCLFGVVPTGDHVDSVVTEGADTATSVETTLVAENGDVGRICRGRDPQKKKSVSEFSVNGEDKTAMDTKETQSRIEAFLGLDRSIFHAAVYYAQQDTLRFADKTDALRMETITNIFQLQQIDVWQKNAKARAAKLKDQRLALVGKLEGMRRNVDSLESLDLSVDAAQWEEQQARDVATVTSQLSGLDTIISRSTDAEFKAFQAEMIQLEQALSLPEVTTLKNGWHAANHKQATLTAELHKAQTKQVGTCGECGQDVTGEYLGELVARITSEQAATVSTAARLDAQMEDLRRKEARLGILQAEVSSRLTAAEQARHSAASFQRQLDSLSAKENPYTKQMASHADTLAKVKADIDASEAELQSLEQAENQTAFWVTAFSGKGLKSYILDTRLQELTDAANRWVGLLTGNVCWVRFESQKMTRGGNLKNSINIRVFRHNSDGSTTERNYMSWSGGEKQRVSLGIDFGLSRLLAARSHHQYDILILDELFKHLDQSGRVACVELLHELAKEKSSLFVIDHSDDIKGSFENCITIRKHGGHSTIVEEIGYEQQKPAAQHISLPARTPV